MKTIAALFGIVLGAAGAVWATRIPPAAGVNRAVAGAVNAVQPAVIGQANGKPQPLGNEMPIPVGYRPEAGGSPDLFGGTRAATPWNHRQPAIVPPTFP